MTSMAQRSRSGPFAATSTAAGASSVRRARPTCPRYTIPGAEAEVDWGEAHVSLRGERRKVYLFHLRACHSGAAFVSAFPRETQQAFLEGHVEAFRFSGGVFGRIRYDNLRSAVERILRGRRREESDRFVALRSHYLYESVFTMPGIEGAHEKGGVESEIGRFRRRHLMPVPELDSLAGLNELLERACAGDLKQRIAGRAETVGESLGRERRKLRPLPAEQLETCAVPVSLVGLRVQAKLGARELVL